MTNDYGKWLVRNDRSIVVDFVKADVRGGVLLLVSAVVLVGMLVWGLPILARKDADQAKAREAYKIEHGCVRTGRTQSSSHRVGLLSFSETDYEWRCDNGSFWE